MLDLLANFTPFSDQNQSPRNMYQCQMGKQTMGTPVHSFPYRADNKLYKIHTGQAPIVHSKLFKNFLMDEYPNGSNAILAVISYTGYDMEDSVIINRASFERGFGHGSVYKTINIDLKDIMSDETVERYQFANHRPPSKRKQGEEPNKLLYNNLSNDGFPYVGSWVQSGDPIYCIIDSLTGNDKVGRHKEKEAACIQAVKLFGSRNNNDVVEKASITLRFNRNPVIGDKFSSRHGQKGVVSMFWPQEDMPFTESGIYPDIIINPHAFPSRMTIGMLVESMAAKAGALLGTFQDGTPFQFHESGSQLAIDYFGEQLQAAGYSYYGSEPIYSGSSGCLMEADLYIGVVYYQRLRHMVLDKFQSRSLGPLNAITRQPVKGRKRGGGIRLGEMERDSLLSHGISFCLRDRLLHCSDAFLAHICIRCGDLVSTTTEPITSVTEGKETPLRTFCRNPKCKESQYINENQDSPSIEPIILPYIYWYLTNELQAMHISLTLKF